MKKLRVLVLSDEIDRALYDHFDRSMLQDIDMIISCGDLPARYLTFLATMFNGPVLYVCGNHDEKYVTNPPEGCICIEDEIYEYQGIRFLGLGGQPPVQKGAVSVHRSPDGEADPQTVVSAVAEKRIRCAGHTFSCQRPRRRQRCP